MLKKVFEEQTQNILINNEVILEIKNSNFIISFNKNVSKIMIKSLLNSTLTFHIEHDVEIVLFHKSNSSTSNIVVDTKGFRARAIIKSIAITAKSEQFMRNVKLVHSAKNTYTDYRFFGFAFGKSKLTINAITKIHKGMHGSEAHQILRVLTEQDAIASAQPGLLVDDFDVIASHGNSIGQLDKKALYYLMSRGISKQKSRWLIIQGQMKEVLSNMDQDFATSVLNEVKSSMGVSHE